MSNNDDMVDWRKQLRSTRAGRMAVERQRLIVETSENICRLMERVGVSRRQLASRLDSSPSHVTQVLSGSRNMTLRTLSDILFALGSAARVELVEIGGEINIIKECSFHEFAPNWRTKRDSDLSTQWIPIFLKGDGACLGGDGIPSIVS